MTFRSKSPRRTLALAVSLAVLLTLACRLSLADLAEDGNPFAGYDLERESTLFVLGGQPRTLDPALTRGGAGGAVGSIFSGLVSLDPQLQVRPELAAGWDVSPDGTRYTFYLRPNAVFHDGRPVTAADVVYSWERAADPETASDTVLTYLGDVVGLRARQLGEAERISGLTVIDDHTLEVQIDAPKVYFLSKLTYPVAFVVDRETVGDPEWEREPNGTGPFTLQIWEDDQMLILARHDAYYGPRPDLTHVAYFLGAAIPLSLYERDQIDLVWVGGGNLERAQDPNSPLNADLRLGVNMCTSYVTFDVTRPPFDDPLLRQAFSYALDRQRLAAGLYQGHVLPADGLLPPGLPGYTGDVGGYAYAPETARQLLRQAGYASGADLPPVTYSTAGYGSPGGLVTAIITMWQEALEVTVEPVLIDPFTYLDEIYAGNIGNIFTQGWCADYPDPENFLDVLFHSQSQQNLGGYASPMFDALVEEARVETDVTRRLGLYQQAERLLVQEAPAVFLNHSESAVLVKPWVRNYTLTPLDVAQWHYVELDR